jgi:hypothetical protein
MNEFKILSELKTNYPDVYDGYYPFPVPFRGIKPIKIIILGTDPGNNIKGQTVRIKYVFGLENQKSPYFKQISKNLSLMQNINFDEIYVQNVCRCYFKVDTYKNKYWNEIARKYWLPLLKQELDFLFNPGIPVFITTEKILEVITDQKINASKIYTKNIIIQHSDNYLGRKIIAFYRHPKYSLDSWQGYLNHLKKLILPI